MSDMTVRENPEASRYEVFVDGEFAGIADYQLTDTEIIFPLVEVDPQFRGRGVAAELVRFALNAVRDEGTRTVVPVCPYVQTFIRRYPEYQSLLEAPAGSTAED